jgi:site-specific DNA-methyltransferase (adenine-specific)
LVEKVEKGGAAMIDLLNVDCMEYMKGLEDNAFELAIVDPPYGIGVNVSMGRRAGMKHSGHHKFHGGDIEPPKSAYFENLRRISKNQIIWGANHFVSLLPTPADSPCWLMWDKGHSEEVTFAQFELAWTSFSTTCKKFDKTVQSDRFRIHPTQKPVKLYEWLLKNYAKEGDRILDTHLGSGSSAIAAHYGGFDFVGCELDEDYYRASVKRFDSETSQMAMAL